jgi:uncharacterized YccA/Bax inhibitor family protein
MSSWVARTLVPKGLLYVTNSIPWSDIRCGVVTMAMHLNMLGLINSLALILIVVFHSRNKVICLASTEPARAKLQQLLTNGRLRRPGGLLSVRTGTCRQTT